MDLYIRQKVFTLADKYDITDENENPVFRVEGEFLSFGARLHLYGPDMRELYYVEQELFHFMPRYNIYAGQTSAAAVKKNFTLFDGGERLRTFRNRGQRIRLGFRNPV